MPSELLGTQRWINLDRFMLTKESNKVESDLLARNIPDECNPFSISQLKYS